MKKGRFGLLAKRQGVRQASSPHMELYRHCSQLPLDRFIACLVDNDLSQLVIKGNPSKDQLSFAWQAIYIEYIQLNQSNEALYSIRLQSEIELLSDEIQRVEEILYFLRPEMLPFCNGMEAELVNILKYYGYRQVIDFTTDYSRTLTAIRNKLNPKKLRLESRIAELANYMDSKNTGTPDRSVFETNLIRMSRFQGYAIRAKEVTVSEYVTIFKECIAQKKEDAE